MFVITFFLPIYEISSCEKIHLKGLILFYFKLIIERLILYTSMCNAQYTWHAQNTPDIQEMMALLY